MLVLSIFVAVLGIVQIFVFARISKVNENIDKLSHEIFRHEGKLSEHKNRIDAHYSDIVRNEKKIEANSSDIYTLSKRLSTHIQETQEVVVEPNNNLGDTKEDLAVISDKNQAAVELNERREKFAMYRKQGMDVKSAGKAVGVSFTTAKRYEKWMLDNNK